MTCSLYGFRPVTRNLRYSRQSMLISSGHGINLDPAIPEEFGLLLWSPNRVGNIQSLLNSSTLINLLDPLLQKRELGQINLQGSTSAANPGKIRNIGNSVLLTRQVRAFLQSRLED